MICSMYLLQIMMVYNDLFHFNEWMLNGIYVEIFNRWGEKFIIGTI